MGFAKAFLVGRTTREIDLRYTSTKKMAIATFDLAVTLGFGTKKTSNYFRIKAFGAVAENLSKYVHKGMKLELECEAHTESYETKDGKKVSNTVFYVQKWEFAESKSSQQEHKEEPKTEPAPAPVNQPWMTVPDGIESELPFV